MPLVATKCNIVSNTAGASDKYWIAILGQNNVTFNAYRIRTKVDANNDIFFAGMCTNGGSLQNLFGKISSSGKLQYSHLIAETSISLRDPDTGPDSFVVDESGNAYIVGWADGSSTDYGYLIGCDSSGAKIADFRYKVGTDIVQIAAVRPADSSYSSLYLLALVPGADIAAFKVNVSTGAISWQTEIAHGSNGYGMETGVDVDSSYNIISLNRDYTQDLPILTKWNSSGSRFWSEPFDHGSGTSNVEPMGLRVFGSNAYMVYRDTTSNCFFVVKNNVSGSGEFTWSWSRKLTLSLGSSSNRGGIAVDSNENVYTLTYFAGADGQFLLAKYNSSGTLQWQRKITAVVGGSLGTFNLNGIDLDSDDNIVLSGIAINIFSSVTTPEGVIIFKLPNDGSGLGTYELSDTQSVQITYEYGYATDVSATLRKTGTPPSTSSPGLSLTAGSASVSSLSLLEEKVKVS